MDDDTNVKVITCEVPAPKERRDWTMTPALIALYVMLGWLTAAGVALLFDFPWN